MANKQIKDFTEIINPDKEDLLLLQTAGGVTKKVTSNNALGKDFRHAAEHAVSTTLVEGGDLSLNGTKFDVAAGEGIYVDYFTDPGNPVIINVAWASTTLITPISGTISITIYIDSAGAIQQSAGTSVDNVIKQGQNGIILGAIQTDGLGSAVLATKGTTNYGATPGRSVSELALAIGPQKITGLSLQTNGANLNINHQAGVMYQHGGFIYTDSKQTSTKLFNADSAFNMIGIYRDGSGGYLTNDMTQKGASNELDAGSLDDDSGTLTTYSNTKYGLFEFYQNITGQKFVIYPQVEYSSIDSAKEGIELDTRAIPEDVGTALLLGWIIVRGNNTDLTNASQALILNSKGAFTGSVGSAANSLQQAYDVSNSPEITVGDTTDGAMTVKDSPTNTNRDDIFEVTDTSDVAQFAVDRNGVSKIGGLIDSGTYTPTSSNSVNMDGDTPRLCYYQRIGNIVTVHGTINLDATLADTITVLELTVPIDPPSNFDSSFDAAGTMSVLNLDKCNGVVQAVSSSKRVKLHYFSAATFQGTYTFSFSYELV